MVVTVQAVALKCRTRFKRRSSRTPGTTTAFSRSLNVIFNTHGERKSVSRTRTDLSLPN